VLASLPTPFRCVTYLEPGQSTAVSQDVRVLATAGTLLGPPWERPENGYVLLMPAGDDDRNNGLLYYEPHCLHDRSFLERKRVRADVVITPVVKQLLPLPGNGNYYTLVAGQEEAVDLAGMLRARYVVPMSNADLDAGGLLTAVLTEQGTTQSFQALLSEALPQVQVLDPTPGVPLHLDLDLDLN
jgi:L-ascorbate metabolism protein UlaG (beta-lactamase superfamily)